MVPVLLPLLLLGVLVLIVAKTSVKGRDDGLMLAMVGGYLLRMVIQTFVRDLPLFSHGTGGDYLFYEHWAVEITRVWSLSGFEFVTSDDLPGVGPTALPPNLYALVIALNDGERTPFGCTAPVALMACLTCLNLYHLAVELGAQPRRSFHLTLALLFSPAFLLYSSDTYKDGPVLFFTVGALASAIRVSRRFSLVQLTIGALCLWALWYVRYYLLFVATAPLIVGIAGLGAKSAVRPILATLMLLGVMTVVVASTDLVDEVNETATAAFAKGTEESTLTGNADAGSGVTFDDGGNPFNALGQKLLYLLFSPFPWAGGSIGFNIGKIDTLLWYFIMYRGWLAAKRMWRSQRTVLLMLLTFLAPTIFMYSLTFANVGLSLRQRLVVVFVGAVLAMLSWPVKQATPRPVTAASRGPARPAWVPRRA